MRPVAVINPMKSRRPTGIGIAGDAIPGLLPPGVAVSSPRLDRWFVAINDAVWLGSFRTWLRLMLVQLAPLFFPRGARLLFTSHQAPLWRTGRHALVLHDAIPLQFPRQARVQAWYFHRLLPRAVRCAERVIAISAAARDEFVRHGMRAVEAATLIPSLPPKLPVESSSSRVEHELLVVGARYPHKNVDVVLAVLELLNRESPTAWRLTLAGCERGLWARAWGGLEYFERAGWVRVIERVSGEELAALYARATVLVYPSLAEGQGLPPLEALAAGCPVVCSDIPALRETCGDAALYFPARDGEALARLIVDGVEQVAPAERVARSAAARERLQQFSREALAARWRAFLEEWL